MCASGQPTGVYSKFSFLPFFFFLAPRGECLGLAFAAHMLEIDYKCGQQRRESLWPLAMLLSEKLAQKHTAFFPLVPPPLFSRLTNVCCAIVFFSLADRASSQVVTSRQPVLPFPLLTVGIHVRLNFYLANKGTVKSRRDVQHKQRPQACGFSERCPDCCYSRL